MPTRHSNTNDFSTLFEFLPLGAYRSTPEGVQLRANPALARLNGYTSEGEQLAANCDIARSWYVDPARRDEFKRLMDRDGYVVGFESEVYRYRTRQRIWISENAHLVRDAQGQALFYEGTVEEITDRVHAREALRRSQQQLRQLIELVPGMVYRIDIQPDGTRRPIYISAGSRSVFGVEPEEMLADVGLLGRLRHPDDRDRMQTESEAAHRDRALWRAEFRVVLQSGPHQGETRWIQLTSAPVPVPREGGLEARVGVMVDITAIKQAQTLRLELDRAEAADRLKSEFLSRVSHELRTPLNAVLGFAQLMEMDPGQGDARDVRARQLGWTRQVLASGRHLQALVDDILDLSSAQTGRLSLNSERVALGDVAVEAHNLISAQAAQAGVQLLVDAVPQDLPAAQGDRKRLVQVLCNLLSNAVKYNQPGGWARLQMRATMDDGEPAVAITVSDNGPGLDDEQQARLFQPFERVGAQRGTVAGTGLGLALSRQLVEGMGGSITVHSQPGAGASFRVWLKAAMDRSG